MELIGQRILIVEDDPTFSRVIAEFLTREHHTVACAKNSFEAFELLAESEPFDFLIVDWQLSGMTGLDIISQARQRFPRMKFQTILMSGVYREELLIKEAKRRARTSHFLVKPFSLDILKEIVPAAKSIEEMKKLSDIQKHPRKVLYDLFMEEKITPRKQRKAIEGLDEVWDYDLPFIISLLVSAETSGSLLIYHSNKDISSVKFASGKIVQVDFADQLQAFKAHIQSSAYSGEYQEFDINNENIRVYAQKVRDSGMFDDDGINSLVYSFIKDSLIKLVREEKIRVSFVFEENEVVQPNIDQETLFECLHDWVNFKVSAEWLKAQFNPWMNNRLKVGASFVDDHPICRSYLGSSTNELMAEVRSGVVLRDLLKSSRFNEDNLLKLLLLAFMTRVVMVSSEVVPMTDVDQLEILKSIQKSFHGLSPYQIFLTIKSKTVNSSTSEEMIQEYVEHLGPSPSYHKKEVYLLWNRLYDVVADCLKSAKDKEQIIAAQQEKRKKQLEIAKKIKSGMESALSLLLAQKYHEAHKVLVGVMALNPATYRGHVLMAWALLGKLTPMSRGQQLKHIEGELLQVPHDERADCYYYYCAAWHLDQTGKFNESRRFLEKALKIDPTFLPALKLMYPQNYTTTKQIVPGSTPVPIHAQVQMDEEKTIVEFVTSIFKKTS